MDGNWNMVFIKEAVYLFNCNKINALVTEGGFSSGVIRKFHMQSSQLMGLR